MLLTVKECSFILDTTADRIYYMCEMSQCSAIKVLASWRIDETSLREMYGRVTNERTGKPTDNFGLGRFEARLEIVRSEFISNEQRRKSSHVQGGQRMVRKQRRPNKLAPSKQLELWENGNYW